MPKKLDKIHDAIVRKLKGKTNPRTKKPYTESELWAIARAQYNESKKAFSFMAPISKTWEEEIDGDIKKSAGKTIEKGKHRFVEVVVSGLDNDRQNERMSQEAIDDMIGQFKSGSIPFFADHGRDPNTGQMGVYPWQGMMGVWTDAFQEGNHLKAVVRLNSAHPDAEMFWNFLQEGMPIGFSIGGTPEEAPEFVEESVDEISIEKARGEGQGVGGERQGDGGAEECVCPKCNYKTIHKKGTPCGTCPKCGAKMIGK